MVHYHTIVYRLLPLVRVIHQWGEVGPSVHRGFAHANRIAFFFLSQFFYIGFQITFGIAEVVLLLPPHDPEFGLTIVMLVAVVVVCVLIHTLVRAIEYLAHNIS